MLQGPAFRRSASGRSRGLTGRANRAGSEPAPPAVGQSHRVALEDYSGAKRKLEMRGADPHRGPVAPGCRPSPPFFDRRVFTLVQIARVDPPIIAIEVSADPAPLPALAGDCRGLAQHQLSDLLCPNPRLGQDWSNGGTRYGSWHEVLRLRRPSPGRCGRRTHDRV